MNIGNLFIPDYIVFTLLMTNTIFSIIMVAKRNSIVVNTSDNDDFTFDPKILLDRIISICSDTTGRYISNIMDNAKNNDRIFISIEDILVDIEKSIVVLQKSATNVESKLYYSELIHMYYYCIDEIRYNTAELIKAHIGEDERFKMVNIYRDLSKFESDDVDVDKE